MPSVKGEKIEFIGEDLSDGYLVKGDTWNIYAANGLKAFADAVNGGSTQIIACYNRGGH